MLELIYFDTRTNTWLRLHLDKTSIVLAQTHPWQSAFYNLPVEPWWLHSNLKNSCLTGLSMSRNSTSALKFLKAHHVQVLTQRHSQRASFARQYRISRPVFAKN